MPSNFLTDTSFDEALDLLVLRKQALDEGVAEPLPASLMSEADVLQKAASILQQKQAFSPDLRQAAMMAGGGSLLGGVAGLAAAKPGRRSWRNALEGALAGGLTGGGLSLVDQAAGTGVGAGLQKAMTGKAPEPLPVPVASGSGVDENVLSKTESALAAPNVDAWSGGALGGAAGGTYGAARRFIGALKRPRLNPAKLQNQIKEQLLDKLNASSIVNSKLPDEALRSLHQLRLNVTDAANSRGFFGLGRRERAFTSASPLQFDADATKNWLTSLLDSNKSNTAARDARRQFAKATKNVPDAEKILRNVELPTGKAVQEGAEALSGGLIGRVAGQAQPSAAARYGRAGYRALGGGALYSLPGTLLGALAGDRLEQARNARVLEATQAAMASPLTSDEVKARIAALAQ